MLTLTQLGPDEFVLVLSFAVIYGTGNYITLQLEKLGLRPSEIQFLFNTLHEQACKTFKQAANS